jgi:hypothetical protein
MPELKNRKHENFCWYYAVMGMPQGKAALKADMASATGPMKRPEVLARIEELTRETRARQMKTGDDIIAEFEKMAFVKMDPKKIKASDKHKALESLGKVHGIFEKDNEQGAIMVAPQIIVFQGKK